MKKKTKFGEEYLVRDSIGIINVDATLDRIVLNAQNNIKKIIEEEQFDLSEKEIKELCLAVFYSRPELKFIGVNPLIMMAINRLEVPARRFNIINDKFIAWIKQDCAAKRGSFRMEGNNVVLRSRTPRR